LQGMQHGLYTCTIGPMKRVKVDTVAPPANPDGAMTEQRLYTVSLGNHVVVHFASKRQALAFQADATRFLTDTLMSANLLLADAFTAYRLAWPYFTANDTTLQVHVRDAEHALDRAARTSGQNAVFFRWRSLHDALASIRTMAIALEAMYAQKSHGVAKHQATVIVARCNQLSDALKHYGEDRDTARSVHLSPYGAGSHLVR
jgi:hypothetical protein